ncbi:MAG: DNA-directed RNA polymerase subunit beta' [Candidatus Wallbacteria bacterium]|nr:DNA-directed RNA polymerase subunit beta' [Candidatus Wallbacteria bacterium]
MWDLNNDFNGLRISLASPDDIKKWSFGEVKKPETINYRTHKPERDGLFCERTFGPMRDYTCYCGKYKSIRYRGIICERCGVEITKASARRERMGHIDLAASVAHVWFSRGTPSYISLLLDISPRDLEKILYFTAYIVLDPGPLPLVKKQILTEEEYSTYTEKYGEVFRAGIGAEAIKELLTEINLDDLINDLQNQMREKAGTAKKNVIKRLDVARMFKNSGNRPEWMIMDVLPVIPPDLRPMVQLDGGRFASADLNDLYRRVINRNNRLKRLINLGAPDIIIKNEKRMLQEAVNALIDNSKRIRPVTSGGGKRPLKSLTDMLKGKQGRFRQNLLGKRVDYSGRSVIVVGPKLKLHQCGLPKRMALELFKPFIMHKLVATGKAYNIKSAKKMLEKGHEELWDVLDEVIKGHPVLLNRAPTLHRLGIQAFEPILVEGNAIQIHPLVCNAYNADFDGDQMAVHVPLLMDAQAEARHLMLSTNNIFLPSSGKPTSVPTHDMTIGFYYLTRALDPVEKTEVEVSEYLLKRKLPYFFAGFIGKADEANKIPSGSEVDAKIVEKLTAAKIKKILVFGERFFSTFEEIQLAYQSEKLDLFSKFWLKLENGEFIRTTAGRVIFNGILPKNLRYINKQVKKADLSNIISDCFELNGTDVTVEMLDKLKEIGFKYATRSGLSISVGDLAIPPQKKEIIRKAENRTEDIQKRFVTQSITREEKRQSDIDIWNQAVEDMTDKMLENFKIEEDLGKFNSVYAMAISGARGNIQQMRQLTTMRGLMSNPNGNIIDFPIRSNFREGLKVTEYFISTYGARKGVVDTALRTADSGYLTRRLVDVAQDVIITEEDCGTINGVEIKPLRESRDINKLAVDEIMISMKDRISGRIAAEDIIHPATGEMLVHAGNEISRSKADQVDSAEVFIEVTENIVGMICSSVIVDPITGKVIIAADKIINRWAFNRIKNSGITQIKVRPRVVLRSPITCESKFGICQKCYSNDLATSKLVNIGEAVGVIAAQSIGEPGTQLTMRTFHTGGVAFAQRIVVSAKAPGTVSLDNLRSISKLDRSKHEVVAVGEKGGEEGPEVERDFDQDVREIVIKGYAEIIRHDGVRDKYVLPSGSQLKVVDGQKISAGDIIVEYNPNQIVAEYDGKVFFEKPQLKVKDGVVVSDGGRVIVDSPEGKEYYLVPQGAFIRVNDDAEIKAGDTIAEAVAEQKAVITGIDGHIEFYNMKVKNQRAIGEGGIIYIIPEDKSHFVQAEYPLPPGVKERRDEFEEDYEGVVLMVKNGNQIKYQDEILAIFSEINGSIRVNKGKYIQVKKDEKREYNISTDIPHSVDKKEKKVFFHTDQGGLVQIVTSKASKKAMEIKRVIINEEENYTLPKDLKIKVDDARIKQGDFAQKGEEIISARPFIAETDGQVELKVGGQLVEAEHNGLADVVKNLLIKNVRVISASKKSNLKEKLVGKILFSDVLSKSGQVMLKAGEKISEEWVNQNLVVSEIDGTLGLEEEITIDLTSVQDKDLVEKILSREIELNKKVLAKTDTVLNLELIAELRKNGIEKIYLRDNVITIRDTQDILLNRKEVFRDEIINRALSTDVINKKTGEVIAEAGTIIGEELCDRLDKEKFYVKKISITRTLKLRYPEGASLKVKPDTQVKAGQELIMPTHLNDIQTIDREDRYEIPKGIELLVKSGQWVKKDEALTSSCEPIVSGITGKVNFITIFDKETGEEMIKKITVYAGREFNFPATLPLKVKDGDFVKPGDPLTEEILFEELNKKEKEMNVLVFERMEKKYRISPEMKLLVDNNDDVSRGQKLAVLQNDKCHLERVNQETVNFKKAPYRITTRFKPIFDVDIRPLTDKQEKSKPLTAGVEIDLQNGEIVFSTKVKTGEYVISYHYLSDGVVKLIRKVTKEGKIRTSLDKVVVQTGEAHHITDGAEVKVEDLVLNMKGKRNFVDKIEGKVTTSTVMNQDTKRVIVREGEEITPKIARTLLRERNSLNLERMRIVDAVKTGDIIARFETVSKKTIDIVQGLPRVAELFEIRKPKKEAMIVENDGVVRLIGNNVIIESFDGFKKQYKTRSGVSNLLVADGEIVKTGDQLTDGNIFPKRLMEMAGFETAVSYLLNEIQRVYRSQGVRINDKHIEIILRQMFRKVMISESGDTELLQDELMNINDFKVLNDQLLKDTKAPARGMRILQGITKASLTTESFISAASFQETVRVLTKAAAAGKIDKLRGLKENIIIGRLFPAGTGFELYQRMEVAPLEEDKVEPQPVPEITEEEVVDEPGEAEA